MTDPTLSLPGLQALIEQIEPLLWTLTLCAGCGTHYLRCRCCSIGVRGGAKEGVEAQCNWHPDKPHADTCALAQLSALLVVQGGVQQEEKDQEEALTRRDTQAETSDDPPQPPLGDTSTLKAACLDCGRDYADFGMDVLLPRHQWLTIHPEEHGLLCALCITKRAATLRGAVALHAVIGIVPDSGESKVSAEYPNQAGQEACEPFVLKHPSTRPVPATARPTDGNSAQKGK